MARFILETAGEDITVGGTDVEVIGTNAGGEVVTIVGGNITLDASFAAGGDTIELAGEAETYTATLSGSRVILTSSTGATISIPVGTTGVAVEFGGDDVRELRVEGGAVMFGEQTVTAGADTDLDPGNDEIMTLTQAVQNLEGAQEALEDFLADNDLDNNPATATTAADIRAAEGAARTALDSDVTNDGTDRELAAEVTVQEAELADAQDAVAAEAGLPEAISDLEATQEEYQSDIADAQVAYAELNGEVTAYNTLNDPDLALTVTDAEGLSNLTVGDDVVTRGGVMVVEVGANGQLVAAAGAPADVVAAAQAAYAAALEMDASQEAFEDAIEDVLALEGVTNPDGSLYYTEADGELNASFDTDAPLTSDLWTERADVQAAEAEVTERQELRQDLSEAQDLVAQLEDLEEGITDAEQAIDDLGYQVPVTVVDGDIVTADAAGTPVDNDIFILDMGDGTGAATVVNFGEDGDDILFVGSGYTATDVAEGVNVAGTDQGSVSTLEVFIQQDGDDTILYFEDEAFAGSATNGFQGFTVTLEDVDADTVTLDATGYITIEEMPIA